MRETLAIRYAELGDIDKPGVLSAIYEGQRAESLQHRPSRSHPGQCTSDKDTHTRRFWQEFLEASGIRRATAAMFSDVRAPAREISVQRTAQAVT